jgi:hypothetical protein
MANILDLPPEIILKLISLILAEFENNAQFQNEDATTHELGPTRGPIFRKNAGIASLSLAHTRLRAICLQVLFSSVRVMVRSGIALDAEKSLVKFRLLLRGRPHLAEQIK